MSIDYRFRNIVIAAVLAAAAVLLTVVYVSTARDENAAAKESVTVYVPTRSFPIGTSGAKVAGSLEQQKVARSAVAPKAVTAPAEIENLYSTESIYAGEQLTLNRFVKPKEQGVRSKLAGNQRAVQVSGDPNQMLDGTLEPGDRVDVLTTLRNPFNQNDVRSFVVLHNLRVLQTQESEGATINNPDNDTAAAILAMSDDQAQRFAYTLANSNDQWWLELRPVKKPKDSATQPATFRTVVRGDR